MQHTFIATYNINGQPVDKQEMTYDDEDIKTTLTRRIKTAFPNATNVQIVRKPEEQHDLLRAKK